MMENTKKRKSHLERGLLIFLFFGVVISFGGLGDKARAGSADFEYWCQVSSGHPCSSAGNIWINVSTNKDVYDSGEAIDVTVVLSSDDLPTPPFSPIVRIDGGADLFPGTFSADDLRGIVVQTFTSVAAAPGTAGAFNLRVNTGMSGYIPAFGISQIFIPLSVAVAPSGTINVSANITGASWSLTGPATQSGSGVSASYASQPTGLYTITWGAVAGYGTPPSSSQTLTNGGTIAFSENYTLFSCNSLPTSNVTAYASPDNSGLSADTAYSYSAADTSAKCEYACDTYSNRNGASCVTNVCQGSVPADATMFANDNVNLTDNTTNYSYSAIDTGTRCQYSCNSGYDWDGTGCVTTTYFCTGLPTTNVTAYSPPDNSGLSADTAYSYSAADTSARCEYACDTYSNRNGASCVTNVCQGSVPADATMFANDNVNLTDNTTNYSYSAIDTGTRCQYSCNSGYDWDGTGCFVPSPSPTVDLKINGSDGPLNLLQGDMKTITWTVTDADTCTASSGDGWSGGKALSGGPDSVVATTSSNHTLSCSGPGGDTSDSVWVNVSCAPSTGAYGACQCPQETKTRTNISPSCISWTETSDCTNAEKDTCRNYNWKEVAP